MRAFLKPFLVGAAFALGALIVPAFAVGIQTFVGPGRTGGPVINFPAVLGDLNTLINSMNAEVFSYISLSPTANEAGELEMTSASAFAVNGTIATSLGSVGPLGSHTTVQEWLVVIDSAGNARYIPAF